MARLAQSVIPGIFLLALAFSPVDAGQSADVLETKNEEYPIPEHGALTLDVPVPWQAIFFQPPYNQFPTITFSPLDSKRFQLFVTVLWDTAFDGDVTSPEALKALVERVGQEALTHSDEEALNVKPIEGTDRPGYLFDLSDQSAPSGEYKYLTQGAMSVDDLVLTFTLLTQEPDSLDRTEVLRMLRSARQKKYRQDVRQSLRLPSLFIHTRDAP